MIQSNSGFIHFEGSDRELNSKQLQLLQEMYLVEAKLVSGPKAGSIPFQCWSIEWMVSKMNCEQAILLPLVHELVKKGHMMKIPARQGEATLHTARNQMDGSTDRYISRVAEMVRTIGSIHHYRTITESEAESRGEVIVEEENEAPESGLSGQSEENRMKDESKFHPQLIEGVKWIPELVLSAPRDIPIQTIMNEAKERMQQADIRTLKPRDGWTVDIPIGKALEILQFVFSGIEKSFGGNVFLSRFQVDSILSSLQQTWQNQSSKTAVMISAGTGTGKTLGFLIPCLVDSMIDNYALFLSNSNHLKKRFSQLLLYPRVDLALDQFENLNKIIKAMKKVAEDYQPPLAVDWKDLIPTIKEDAASSLKFVGGKEEYSNVYDAASRFYGGKDGDAAQIMIAGIDSFKNRLFHPIVNGSVKTSLHRVVLDEIHLSEGLTGAHHAALLNRVRTIAGTAARNSRKRIQFIGCSATIARARRHTSRIWFSNEEQQNEVELITPNEHETKLSPTLIRNHILVTNRRTIDRVGSLYDLTSLVGHQRRNKDFAEQRSRPGKRVKEWQKTIGFADSLNIVGRWQEQMTKNERTRVKYRITQDSKKKIELPYPHWFSTPLSNLGETGKTICNECKKCEKKTTMELSRKDIEFLKVSISKDEDYEKFAMDALEEIVPQGEESIVVSALDGCPFLQAATCWWFSPRTEAKEKRPKDSNYLTFQEVLRVRQHTAGTRGNSSSNTEEEKADGANNLFKHSPYEAYNKGNSSEQNKKILYDVVVASPTLEVGVDMDNVVDIITHKAIRNIASYRQKVGRAGRTEFTDVTTSTLISRRPGDFQHYRSPYRLIHKKMVEPVPLALQNRSIKRSHAYMAVFDWLPQKGHYIDSITKESKTWHVRIRDAVEFLTTQNQPDSELVKYIRTATNVNRNDASEAVKVALHHLSLFTKKVKTKFYNFSEEGLMTLAQLTQHNIRLSGGGGWGGIEDAEGSSDSSKVLKNLSRIHTSLKENRNDIISEGGGFSSSVSRDLLEVLEKFIQGATDEKQNVQKLVLDFENEIEQESQEFKEDFEYEIEEILPKLNKLKSILEDDALEIKTSQHLLLARQITRLSNARFYPYLQSIFRACTALHEHNEYTMLEAFFVNPHESKVEIKEVKFDGTASGSSLEPMGIALRDYLPGAWTYRNGGIPKHIQSGEILAAYLSVDLKAEHDHELGTPPKVEVIKTQTAEEMDSIPLWARGHIPFGVEAEYLKPVSVTIKREEGAQLGSLRDNTVIEVHRENNFALGKDVKKEVPQELIKMSMIPNCFPINWTTCGTVEFSSTEYGTEVEQFSPIGNENSPSRRPARNHPLGNHLFKSIRYKKGVEMHHLVTGLDRGNLERLGYRFGEKWAVFADNYSTNGIAFHLSDNLRQKMNKYAQNWRDHPFETSHLDAWGLFLDEKRVTKLDSGNADVFSREDFLDSQLHAVRKLLGKHPETFGEFIDALTDAELDVRGSITEKLASKPENQGETQLRGIHELYQHLQPSLDTLWIQQWVRRTVLNTLGGLMIETGSKFAGVDAHKLGYAFDDEKSILYLYDADAEGNGTVDMIREYMHIPEAARSAQHLFGGERLPSEDFFTVFERFLMICSEHVIHKMAMTNAASNDDIPEDWKEEAKRLHVQSEGEWNGLRVGSVREASLQSRLVEFGNRSEEDSGKRDRQRQAFDLCSFGCSICQSNSNIIPYHAKEALTSRGVLDEILNLQEAKGYALVNSESTQLEDLWGVEDDGLLYNYQNPESEYGGFDEIHVQLPTVLSIHGTRSRQESNFSSLVRFIEEIGGD